MIHQIGEREPDYVLLDSGLIVPEDVAVDRARKRLTGVDLFAGAGGFSLGMIQAGGEVVAAVESDPKCVITYMTNLCRWGRVKLHFLSDEDEAKLEKELQRSFKEQEKKLKKNRKRVVTTEYPRDKSDVLRFMPVAGSGWIAGQSDSVLGVANIIVGDVRKLTGVKLLEIIGMKKGELGCMFGGPPCQGFSVMGKRDRSDGRNPLIFEFARLVIETQPKTAWCCGSDAPRKAAAEN
jgi:DNA (cytosine-5)-methyltransferase 1